MRRLAFALLLALLVFGGYLFFGGSGQSGGPARYVTASVERGPIAATITATGIVNPVSSVEVGTYVSGPIEALFADYNTPVRQGQLLARIDQRPFQVKVDGAAADLANAKARLDKDRADAVQKQLTVKRTRELGTAGIVSASDLDLAESQDRQAKAQVELDRAEVQSAEAKLRESQVSLAYTEIVSPVDGVVV